MMAHLWFTCNKLKINPDKSQRIVFSTNKRMEMQTVKLLGFKVDSRLEWTPHILQLNSKLSSVIYFLRRLRSFLPTWAVVSAYHALFESLVSYGVVLWGDSTNADSVFKQQKKAIRAICRLGPAESCRLHFAGLRLMTLPSLFIFNSLLEIHKHLPGIRTNCSIHAYNTRYANDLVIPYSRFASSQKNKLNLHLFNHLPQELREKTFYPFKKLIRTHLIENVYYSVEEFLSTPWPETSF